MSQPLIYYGGSFNPPHIAHYLFVAALKAYYPDWTIWVAPTFSHAFNKALMPYELRLAMLEDMFAPLKDVEISRIESSLNKSPSYTIDVVRYLRTLVPDREIYLAVGADIVPTLPQWRDYDELQKIAQFLIFPREGCDNSMAIDMPHLPDISSTLLRQWMDEGRWDLIKPWMPLRAFERLRANAECGMRNAELNLQN
ncbi:MAG: nicotinate-nicotinamide nucleotide adenylyltransferase [Proteobacteria bacterium]|nr:nicotinate-nicotinamide nucleotide adenylyltransferase [Pseudomonadota bacterium]